MLRYEISEVSSFIKRVLTTIRQYHLFQPGEHVIVGISGGPDSMALLHVLATLRTPIGFSLTAVYADHGLRPDETQQEKDLAMKQTELLVGITFRWSAIPVKKYALTHGLSLEESGRILRYRLFSDIAVEEHGAKIAVAHHADDQAEEILLRLLRGAGRKGLAGMSFLVTGRIVRPFLDMEKKEILDYLHRKKIPYLIDSSNLRRIYLRNRVRLDLIPYLAKHFNPNIPATLRRVAAIIGKEDDFLNELAQKAYREVLSAKEEDKTLTSCYSRIVLMRQPLAAMHEAMSRRVLEMCLWEMDSCPTFRIIEDILSFARKGKPGGRLHFAEGLRVQGDSEHILLHYPLGKTRTRKDLLLEEKTFTRMCIESPGEYCIDAIKAKILFEEMKAVPDALDLPGVELMDKEIASFPLTLRPPMRGDRFHPLGAPGRKKVNDFLMEKKIPRQKRGAVPILEKDGHILALLGMRIDHRARVTKNTSFVLKISVTNSQD